jgi:predicted ribosome quality control (RQC) complex YloA/Tae2 family protein
MKIDTVIILNISNKGIIFYTGSNENENEELIKESNQEEYWFHVSNNSSCHVVTRLENNIITKDNLRYLIKQGAIICKKNSKYKSVKNLEITYTKVKNITFTNRIGSVILKESKKIII